MTIEMNEKGSKAFYRELVNTISQYRQLLKKPDRKLRDQFKDLTGCVVLCAGLLVILILIAATMGMDGLMTVAMVLMAVSIVFSFAYLYNLNRVYRHYESSFAPVVLTMDDEGVEFRKEGAQTVRLPWSSIAFVRCFQESVCFMAKSDSAVAMIVNRKYKNEIVSYLRENRRDVTIIE